MSPAVNWNWGKATALSDDENVTVRLRGFPTESCGTAPSCRIVLRRRGLVSAGGAPPGLTRTTFATDGRFTWTVAVSVMPSLVAMTRAVPEIFPVTVIV